ncbi:MAG TPA: hypothetical protein PKI11_11460 [Candidatus Hydrogenedentes bacterium]|nr:hypothetical protein [Candidatus Hydrogenedentota bacterium]
MDRRAFIRWQVLGILAAAALCAAGGWANSTTVSYQGMLRDATMSPVPDNTYPMRFSIWDAPTGGNKRWGDEDHPAVPTKNGMFSVFLGSNVALGNVFATYGSLWLQVEANTGGVLEVYNPRVPLASVPYAQHAATATSAGNADTLDTLDSSAFALLDHNHSAAQITSGTLSTDRYSAYSDLSAESKIGAGAAQVAAGNHSHVLNDLTNVNVPAPAVGNVLAWSGAQWTNQESPPQGGVREICFSGPANSNQQINCRVQLTPGAGVDFGGCVIVTAAFVHAGYIPTYGCSRLSFVGRNDGWSNNLTTVDIDNYASGNGGTWNFYPEGNGVLLIRKEATGYNGQGHYFVTVKGVNIVGKV